MSDHKNNMAADDTLISSPETTTLPDQAICREALNRRAAEKAPATEDDLDDPSDQVLDDQVARDEELRS